MDRIDLTSQPKDVRLAAHAVGLDHAAPYKRHGKLFYRPYRNYISMSPGAADCAYLDEFVLQGMAIMKIYKNGQYVYFLTRRGLDWLGEQLGIHIYDEED